MDEMGDHETGGQLLRRLPVNMRKDLLNRLDPAMAARFLEVRAHGHVRAQGMLAPLLQVACAWSADSSPQTARGSTLGHKRPRPERCPSCALNPNLGPCMQVVDPPGYIHDCLDGVNELAQVRPVGARRAQPLIPGRTVWVPLPHASTPDHIHAVTALWSLFLDEAAAAKKAWSCA